MFGPICRCSSWGKFAYIVITFVAIATLIGISMAGNKVSPHRVFDREHYEIKSCLSPDLQHHERQLCRFYALMMDAGSTGTRIHIFEYSHDPNNPASPFKLEREVYQETKPGLSDFAVNPVEVRGTIRPLIEKAKSTVPKSLWSHTPLALKATAGLRLLPSHQAEAILDQVEQIFSESPFLVNDDSVSVMSGTDEGIFGWFTLNYLLERLYALILKPEELTDVVSRKLTAVALDLGGGSTQVTFRPLADASLSNAPEGFLKEIRVFNQTIPIYTHSYLGNGLIATRLNILKLNNNPNDLDRHQVSSSCFPPNYALPWNYTGTVLLINGKSEYSYEECHKEVLRFVEHCEIDRPDEINQRDAFAFGYYFDRAEQAYLISQNSNGGYINVSDYQKAAEIACTRTRFGPEHWQPWQCMDLTYIYALLADGYKINPDTQLYLAKKLRNMEVSWALGASYHLLNTYHESGTLQHVSGFRDYYGHRTFGSYSGIFVNAGHYMCSRFYYGLSTLMSYFQLLA